MKKADLYVYLDNVQYRKNYFQNRNRIRGFYVTVPVITNGHMASTIRDIKIDDTQHWRRKYWGHVQDAYRKSENFDKYADEVRRIIYGDYEYLVEINYAFIDFFRRHLGIYTPTTKASDLGVKGERSMLLYDICLKTGADTYLSGPSGRKYLDKDLFRYGDIKIEYHQFVHPFEPPSALDDLMGGNNASKKQDPNV